MYTHVYLQIGVIVEMFVEVFYNTVDLLDSISTLYFSLFMMISSSLELISAILLDRSCRTLTCVVSLAKNLMID
jgi:hypothetical protein